MTDQELLLSISNIMDTKLQPLQNQLVAVEERLNKKFTILSNKIDHLEERVGRLEEKFDRLEERVGRLEEKFDRLEERVGRLEEKFDRLDHKVHNTNLYLENVMNPRLQNIEECYISTYVRYRDTTEKVDSMETDISVMKSVILQHGEQLKMIS